MKIQIEDTEWQALQERVQRLESLLPSRVVGGSAFAVVMNAVSEVFETEPRLICTPRRAWQVLKPKWCAIWLLRDVFGKSHQEIRDMMRHKNHSFITHAMKELANWRSYDREYNEQCRLAGELCLRQKHAYLKAA